MSHKPKFGRWGLHEDIRDASLAWDVKDTHYVARVVTVYRNETRGITMAAVQFPDGSLTEVPVSVTVILDEEPK